MEHEVSSTIRISVELILTALIIAIIALFSVFGYQAYANKQIKNDQSSYMEDICNLYWYDDRIVTASDAVMAMMSYPMQYDFIIEFRAPDGNLIERRERTVANQLENGDYREYWSETSIREMVKGYELANFKSEIITNARKQSVVGLLFTYQEG